MLKVELSYTSVILLRVIQRMGTDTLKKFLHFHSQCDIAQRLRYEEGTLCVHKPVVGIADTHVNTNET